MKKTQEVKAIIYARVSSKDQEEGHSLDAQIQSGYKYAIEKDFAVIGEPFKIVESSAANGRPEFARMVQFVKKQSGKIAIICYCVDRLQRDFDEQYVELQKLIKLDKAEIHYTQNGFVEHRNMDSSQKFRKNLDVLLANDYRNKISDNVKRSIGKKLEEGTILGPAPIGYLNKKRMQAKKEKREPSVVYVDEERAPFIKTMFETYAKGKHSMNDLRVEITKLGLRTKQDKKISKSQVERILSNHFYYGYMQSGGLLHKHVYPTLITKDLFDRCQDVRTGKRVNPCKGENFVAKIFLFSGMLKCRHCGCGYACYNKEKMTKKYGMREYIYVRPTKSQGECKHCIELNENEISEQIEIVLQNLYIPQEYLEQIKNDVKKRVEDQGKDQKKELKILQAQYEQADAGLKDIRHQRFVTKELPEEDYIELKAELQVKRDNAKTSIDLLAQDDKEFEIGVAQVLQLVENATEIWKSSQLSKKRDILGLLFTNFYVSGESVGFTLVEPFKDMLEYSDSPVWLPRRDSNPRPIG
jgi:site-specific DNA recombinase